MHKAVYLTNKLELENTHEPLIIAGLFLERLLVRRVRDLILSAIGSIGITSKEFYDALHPYLRDKTGHFVAEFIAFARSPHDISTYDRYKMWRI